MAEPRGVERKNDGRGGLPNPWLAAGGEPRRYRPGAPRAHEEIASRPRGLDVSRRPCKRGQGYFASHASQLTPNNATNAIEPCCFRNILRLTRPCRPPLSGVVDGLSSSISRKFLTISLQHQHQCANGRDRAGIAV